MGDSFGRPCQGRCLGRKAVFRVLGWDQTQVITAVVGDSSPPVQRSGQADPRKTRRVGLEEFRRRMIVVFKELDLDKDDFIELAEVPSDRRYLFPDVDSDNNGRVDRREFIAYTIPRFKESDANKDGLLTPEEVEAADQLEYETNAPSAFDLTDQNGDGEVDKEEYRVRMLVVFEILDADEDGLIELPEVPDGHKQSFAVADTDRKPGVNLDEHLAFARSLFERADMDKDGVLTPGEVQSANERAGI